MKLYPFYFLSFVVFLAFAGMSCQSGSQENTDTTPSPNEVRSQQLDSALNAVMEEKELLGLSVIVVEDDSIAYQGFFGKEHVANTISTSQKTRYRIASISKSVTAAATMKLVEQGKLNLDTDINEYLDFSLRNPSFPEQPITLKMLLNHTSSIVDNGRYGAFASSMFKDALHIKSLFLEGEEYYDNDIFLEKQPATFFIYSNVTWGIVGTIVERVSGQNFQAYCEENLFQPLGIEASFDPALLPQPQNLAVLYRADSTGWVPQKDDYGNNYPSPASEDYAVGTNALRYAPQGGLRISAFELSKFMRMLMNRGTFEGKQILSEESVNTMLATQWAFDGENGNTSHNLFKAWGLGIHKLTNTSNADIAIPSLSMVGHPGEAYGLISDMYFDTNLNRGIILITNGKKGSFKTAERSAFYATEEAIFDAVAGFINSNNL